MTIRSVNSFSTQDLRLISSIVDTRFKRYHWSRKSDEQIAMTESKVKSFLCNLYVLDFLDTFWCVLTHASRVRNSRKKYARTIISRFRVALRDLTSDDTAESKYKQTWQQTKRQASKKVNKQVHCRAVSKNLSQKYRIICKI